MTKISKLKLIILASFFLWLIAFSSQAAELNLISQSQEINVGDQFQINVILNAEGEELNAIEGSVIFPSDLIALKKINDGNSIISLWIERPKITSEGKIEFSGIIPGGYKETNGFIFSAFFTTKTNGKGIIEFRNVRALKNDGLGTPVEIKISNFQFNINDVGRRYIDDIRRPEIEDKELPESFAPEIARDETLFEGKWFVVFVTQDKNSGIDHYEAKESRQRILSVFKKWIPAESPYVLADQELRSYIYVKAVDKAGNERITAVEPRYPIKWYEQSLIWVIIVIIGIIAYLVWEKFKNK